MKAASIRKWRKSQGPRKGEHHKSQKPGTLWGRGLVDSDSVAAPEVGDGGSLGSQAPRRLAMAGSWLVRLDQDGTLRS